MMRLRSRPICRYVHQWLVHRSSHSQKLQPLAVSSWHHTSQRGMGTDTSVPLCHRLVHRGLVRVAGADASNFLQGLITNDMTCLHGDCEVHAMYAMMLNVQGRVIHDLLLYNISNQIDKPVFLLECDATGAQDLHKLLKRYKIRKKVDLADVSSEYATWSIFPSQFSPPPPPSDTMSPMLEDQYRVKVTSLEDIVANSPDPRLRAFGRRLILRPDTDACSVVVGSSLPPTPDAYDQRRYELGLGEGVLDMPPGNSIPLENNAVFMNGVSFQKGCYIGQELTARTHHTGVIRKRLMPFKFTSSHTAQPGDKVENSAGKNAGKFRNSCGENALALLRIADVIGQTLYVKNEDGETVGKGETWIPYWWPREADEIVKKVLETGKESESQGK